MLNENRPAPHAIAGIEGNHGEFCCCCCCNPNDEPSENGVLAEDHRLKVLLLFVLVSLGSLASECPPCYQVDSFVIGEQILAKQQSNSS